jgi:Chitobiase/beta-hexosaminidase C-terminal domain/CotH kinase protein/Lamin Tail Domain/PKD domain
MHQGTRRKGRNRTTHTLSRLARAVTRSLPRVRAAHPTSRGASAYLEPLEDRRLLASDLVINEFVADNATGYKDSVYFPNESPDWIEIYNPTEAAVPLGNPTAGLGWKLKDSSATWEFPNGVSIPSKGYLVVFADSKNLRDPSKPLHTNFGLSKDGEYLGLLRPDNSVASEYTPTYPQQNTDVSYGLGTGSITVPLLNAASTMHGLVPTDNSLGNSWQLDTFDDASWLSGQKGIGYETDTASTPAPVGWTVNMVRATSGIIDNVAKATSLLNGNTTGFTVVNSPAQVLPDVNFMTGGHYVGDRALPNGAGPGGTVTDPLREQYALRATAYVTIPQGTYTIGVNSDDGFQLTIPGVVFTSRLQENNTFATSGFNQLTYSSTRNATDTLGTFTVGPGGLTTTINLDVFTSSGTDSSELFIAPGAQTTWSAATFSLLSNGILGWGVRSAAPTPVYTGMFGIDVKNQMLNTNGSAFLRVPFNVDDPADYAKLLLHLKYDDGFVAYINGQKVLSQNDPSVLDWNSTATQDRSDALAVLDQDFEIPVTPGLLKTGANILAIQGLNSAANNSDFLIAPSMEGVTPTQEVQRYFGSPTPGSANTNSFVDRVADTKFSVDRGFFEAPFQLTISSATPGAQIRYTTDGSTPTQGSALYTGPLTINKTTTLRAMAMKPGYITTNVDTETYIFLSDVLTQSPTGVAPPGWPATFAPNTTDYGMDPDIVNSPTWGPNLKNSLRSIPTMSIVTDLKNLFDAAGSTNGIYSHPDLAGITGERPASLELIYPDGTKGFQVNTGLRIRGGFSRTTDNPKHAFRFLFRPEYGDSSLEYDLFKSQNGVDQFDGFDLRTFQNYSWSFQNDSRMIAVRDQFSRDTQIDMGHNAERGDFYHLYVNGQYWGLYNTDERPEASFGAAYYGGVKEDYDVIKVDPQLSYNIEATDGDMNGWTNFLNGANQVRALATAGNLAAANAKYFELMGKNPDGTRNPALPVYLDQDNLIDYMLIAYWGGNLDAPISNFIGNTSPNNWYGIWNRKTKAMGFQFFSHDSEHTLLNATENRLGPFPAGDTLLKSNPQWILQQLLYSPEFRLHVQDQIHKQLFNNGALTPQAASARLIKRRDEISQSIIAESARWGDAKRAVPFTWNDWNSAFNTVLSTFVPVRTGNQMTQFRTQNMGTVAGQTITFYPTLAQKLEAPEFNQFGGTITPGAGGTTITISNPNAQGTIYYTLDGSDPRLIGGAINPNAIAAPANGQLTLTDTALLSARILNGANWTPLTQALFVNATPPPVRVTEIMYHPGDPPVGSQYANSDFEYVELQNISAQPLNLKNFAFTNGIKFTFPDMTLAPGARTLVVANPAAFASRYPGVDPASIAGVFTGDLSNGGEKITLSGRFGEDIVSFKYNDSWYPHTDGEGFSLVAADPNQNLSLYGEKEGWRGSANPGGDPAADVFSYAPRSIAINEIAANVASPNSTWIELKNTTTQPIDISGWFLSNDSTTPAALKKYKFGPDTILQSGQFMLLDEQQTYGLGATGFTLDKHGGNVYLTQADAAENLLGYREIQDYNEMDVGKTAGRYVKSNGAQDYPILASPTPGAANSAPEVGPVVINEINYGPTGNNIEWIELHNNLNQPVQLFDPANPANTWKFTDGVEFTFPTGQTLGPLQFALVVPIDPAAFRTQYNIPASVKIFGPFVGFLDNNGETVRLSRPGTPYLQSTPSGPVTVVPYIHVDRINYNNTAPWPQLPDGYGPSLIRRDSTAYGNDPANWTASPQNGGSPGQINLNTPPVVVAGADAALNEGQTFTQNGTFSDVDFGQTFTGEVNWGDFGANEVLPLNADGTFTLNHTFTDNGTFNVRVRVYDGAGFTDDFVTVVVANVAPTATFAIQGASSVNEGGVKRVVFTNPVDPSSKDVAAGFTYSYDWNNDGVFEVNNTSSALMVVPASVTGDGPRTQVIRARIFDKNGGFSQYTVTLTVNNVAPTVDAIPDANLAGPGTFTYLGTFFDPSELDTFTGTVDWNYHPGDTDAEPLAVNPDYSYELSHNFTSGGTYVVRVAIKDDDGGEGAQTFTVTVPGGDNTPPSVTQSSFQYQTAPRQISVKFSEDVSASLQSGDLTVLNQTTGQPVGAADMTVAWDAPTSTATWTINVPLADGNYLATLSGAGVTDAANNSLDGDGDGVAGGDFTLPFFFLSGDADHDRDVDFNDLVALAQNYGQSGKTFAEGNFDGDAAGNVDFQDLVQLAQRYGTSLPAAGAVAGEALAAQTAAPLPFTIAEYQADPAGTIARAKQAQGGVLIKPVPVVKPKPAPKPAAAPRPAAAATSTVAAINPFSTRKIAPKPARRTNDLLA